MVLHHYFEIDNLLCYSDPHVISPFFSDISITNDHVILLKTVCAFRSEMYLFRRVSGVPDSFLAILILAYKGKASEKDQQQNVTSQQGRHATNTSF